jgi:hypothetical protein
MKKAGKVKRANVEASRKSGRSAGERQVEAKPGRAVAASLTEDQMAIEQLLHRYCHVLDRGTVDEIVALFHRDAVLLPAYESDARHVGRDAVRAWYTNYDRTLRANVHHLRHKIACPVIEISGNTATSVCYLDADAIPTGSDESIVLVGRYDDELVKEAGRWWFKERKIIGYYSRAAGKSSLGRGE